MPDLLNCLFQLWFLCEMEKESELNSLGQHNVNNYTLTVPQRPNQPTKEAEWDSCCVQCPGKFQNRERRNEFCRSRKIISVGCLRRDWPLVGS